MSGTGQRFLDAGYTDIKPLIKVDGKPIIEHLLNLFPDEEHVVFVCRQEHLEETALCDTLMTLKPKAKIVSVKGSKLGPVYAVLQAVDVIDDKEPAIVSYCDFFMDWEYGEFKKEVEENKCDAALPTYTGFHPHLLPEKNLYAGIRIDDRGYMTEIQEKHSFTSDKTKSHHSPGVHYFRKGSDIKKFFQKQIDDNVNLNGEYYVSMIYSVLKDAGLDIFVYDNIPHFCQWGTPEDLEIYEAWSRLFADLSGKEKGQTSVPKDREPFIQTGLEPGTLEYEASYEYWKTFFSKNSFHPFS